MKELQLTILVNVGLLNVAEIFLLPFVSAELPLPNRCPKENPYPFENQTFCCSRPVDLQWRKEGYCYGRSQKCTHNEGCVNYHPLCTKTESLLGIDFPLDEYNKIYNPTLIPTRDFSHRFLFKESSDSSDSENHCIWRDDAGKWIMGLCENIEKNIGIYFLDADSECPSSDEGWKEIENNKSVDGKIKDTTQRVFLGSESKNPNLSPAIKFQKLMRKARKRVRKCESWKKIPYINVWRCLKFNPRIKKTKANNKNTKNRPFIKSEARTNEIPDEFDEFNTYETEKDFADTQKENTVVQRGQEFDYSVDSILYDIF